MDLPDAVNDRIFSQGGYIMNKRNNIKPITTFLALAFAGSAWSASGPFAQIPLHLQNSSTTTSAGGVKPNVLLQIDDSGSMESDVKDKNGVSQGMRIDVTKKALTTLVRNPDFKDKVNWNLITLCNTPDEKNVFQAYLNSPDKPFGLDVESELIPAVNRLRPACVTVSTERYLDSLYILRKTLERNNAYRCQKSYVVLFSDGEPWSLGVKMEGNATKGYAPTNETLTGEINFPDPVGGDGVWFANKSDKYYYRHPNMNTFIGSLLRNANQWNNNLTNPGDRFNGWHTMDDATRYFAEIVNQSDLRTGGFDKAGKSWDDPDVNSGKQTIGTFTIGFGLTSPYLDRMAVSNNGVALSATNQQELDAAFKKIFDQINSENLNKPPVSHASIAPALSGDDTQRKVPSTAASIQLDLQTGSSRINLYDVAADGSVTGTPKTPSFAGRRTVMGKGGNRGGVWFANSMSVTGTTNADFAISGGSNANEWSQSLVQWLNRSIPDANANKPGNALKYRERSETPVDQRNMGDAVNSTITAYGPQYNGRQKYLITAANDGMVYLFESSNDVNHPYALKLNYIPGALPHTTADDTIQKNLKDIVDPDYIKDASKPHQFLVDGGIVIRTTDKDGPQQTFLAGNLGRGGRGMYALNLYGSKRSNGNQKVGLDQPTSNWDKSVPLFETPDGTDADNIGYTIGSPQIGRVTPVRNANGRIMVADLHNVAQAVFMGSGVNSATSPANGANESALYIYNALDKENIGLPVQSGSQPQNLRNAGDLIAKLTVPASMGKGGLMQPTLIDTDFDGVIDIVYAADFGGGLYRFDLRAENISGWKVSKIFQTPNGQPVTSAPAVLRESEGKYVVIFGTGSDLYQSDISDRNQQSVYGIYDDVSVENPALVQRSQLLEQQFSNGVSPNAAFNVRELTDYEFNPAVHKGWFVNLLTEGERVVVKPDLLLRTVVLTTRSYKVTTTGHTSPPVGGDPCIGSTQSVSSSGESWLLTIRGDSGGRLPGANSKDQDKDKFAYLDVTRQNTQKDHRYRPDIILGAISYKNGGLLTYSATTDDNRIGGVASSVTANGDSGGSGQAPELQEGGRRAPKQCFRSKENYVFGSNSSGAQGVNSAIRVYGQLCQTGVRRISWREIF